MRGMSEKSEFQFHTRYVVRRRGTPLAAFGYARDAWRFVENEDERGPFDKEDFEVVDSRPVPEGRTSKVVGLTSHGHAILEAIG